MKKIKIFLDYQCYPMWIYNENGELINNDLLEELKSEADLEEMLDDIQNIYNNLFEDSDICFEYKGFTNDTEKEKFMKKIEQVMQLVSSKVGDNYILENKVSI